MTALLDVRDVVVRFGGIVALDGVSFQIEKGQIVGLIGPNGAGKTTLFNCLSRLYTPNQGEIEFKGRSILGLAPNKIAALGIGRTFQNLALFPTLSVLNNVMIGGHSRTKSDFVSNAFRLPWVRREEGELMAQSMELIEFMGLRDVVDTPVGALPFPYQKRVEMARALAGRPEMSASRRTGWRTEPRRARSPDAANPASARRSGYHGFAGRTSHESRHASIGESRRDRLRPQDCGWHARGGPAGPESDRSLLGNIRLMAFLEVRGLKAFYRQTEALHGLDFELEEGSITTILGANGAGKTTTLRSICQMVRTEGQIVFDGRSLMNLATDKVVQLGIGHVPEGRGTFVRQTVEENLQLGAYTRKNKREIEGDMDRVYDYFPRLRERRRQQAGTLSGGEQQMLAIGRALMLRPRLMLLDEPSFGLAPLIVQEIYQIMRRIREQEGTTMLLVEQNANIALGLADHAYLLETGNVVMSGESHIIRDDENVRRSYLGY